MAGKKQGDEKMITIFFDGLCEPTNPGGVATYGYAIYQDGKSIKKGCRVIGEGHGMTNNLAEFSALKRALEWINEQNINDDIVVKGDSMLVINQMRREWRVKSATSKFFVPIIQKLLKNKNVKFIWIPRDQNVEADMLSRVAYKRHRKQMKENNGGVSGSLTGSTKNVVVDLADPLESTRKATKGKIVIKES